MSKNHLSLRQTMIFLALILLAIVSFTFAYLIFVSQKQGLTQQAEDYLLNHVAEAEWAISYPIEKSQAQLMSIARSPYIITPYDENEVSAEERDDLRQYLIDQLTSKGLFLELFIIDVDGKVLVSTKIEEENTDKSNRAYYQKAQGEVYIQNVYHNLAWQRPVLTLALPLKGKSGDLLGVLAGHFDVHEWDAFLRNARRQTESGVTYLVNDYNYFVTSPRGQSGYAFLKANYSQGVHQCLRGENSVGSYANYQNDLVLGAYVWLDQYDMCLVSEMAESEALSTIPALIRNILSSILFVILLGFLVIVFGANHIVSPLEALARGVSRIAEGDLSYHIKIQANNELGILADSFNLMSKRLKNTFSLLSESENRLKLAVEGTGVGLWDWKVQTGEVTINERWAQIVGYELEELEPTDIQTWLGLCHPEDLGESERLLNLHFDGKNDQYEAELRMKHKDGHWVWILDRGKVSQWSEDGKPLRMTGTHQDITNKVRARQELMQRERHYRDLFNATPDGIIVIELEGGVPIIKSVNPAFSKLMKQSSETFINNNAEIFHFCGGLEFRNRISKVMDILRKQGTWHKEVVIKNGAGEEIEAAFAFNFTHDNITDRPTGLILSVRDVTERNQLDRMKRNFVSNISHELRTPLSIISLYADNLLEFYSRMDEEEHKEILQEITLETTSLQTLIEDVLLLSRIDSGASLNTKKIDLGEVLAGVIKKEVTQSKGIDVNIRMPEKELPLYADADHLRQVFRNLVNNAIKFSPEKDDVSVTIYENDNTYVIEITDYGIGIPAKELPYITDRFNRGQYAQQKEISGTGLGLSITKDIVEKHSGRLEIESEVGKGTTARVILPKGERRL